MTQALRVATWVPTADPAEIGDAVQTTNAPDANKKITTRFQLLGGGSGGGGIPEAPSDGTIYGRQNAGWVPAGGGVTEAPNDGKPYVRQGAAWVDFSVIDAGAF